MSAFIRNLQKVFIGSLLITSFSCAAAETCKVPNYSNFSLEKKISTLHSMLQKSVKGEGGSVFASAGCEVEHIKALGDFDEVTLPILKEHLTSRTPFLAIDIIRTLGPYAKTAIPALKERLSQGPVVKGGRTMNIDVSIKRALKAISIQETPAAKEEAEK